ncbi:MAG: hypothetical protein IKJ91_10090 [Clostridia bacterium]|nr:hypothetical protein [Clostridia bacterium]
MKNIVLNDYYSKLTPKKRKKFKEKKGRLCYYEWFKTLVDDCTPEEIGYIFLGLLHYDRFGGSVELSDFIAEKLSADRALKMTFTIFMDKTCAASKEWINKHKFLQYYHSRFVLLSTFFRKHRRFLHILFYTYIIPYSNIM